MNTATETPAPLYVVRNHKTGRYSTSKKAPKHWSRDYIDETTDHKKARNLAKTLNQKPSHAAFPQLEEIFNRVCDSYRCDFYRSDRMMLETYSPKTFIWSVRSTGTHIVCGEGGDWDKAVLDNAGHNCSTEKFYLWHDGELVQLADADEFRAAYREFIAPLVKEYTVTIGWNYNPRSDWHDERKNITVTSTKGPKEVADNTKTREGQTVTHVSLGHNVVWYYRD